MRWEQKGAFVVWTDPANPGGAGVWLSSSLRSDARGSVYSEPFVDEEGRLRWRESINGGPLEEVTWEEQCRRKERR